MDNKEAVKRLLLLLGRYKKTIVVIVGCLLVSTGLNLCVPLISGESWTMALLAEIRNY